MIKVTIDGFDYQMPSTYSELTPEQQIDFATALKLETNFDSARIRIALPLLGLTVLKKRVIYLYRGEWKRFDADEVPADAVGYFSVMHGKTRIHLLSAIDCLPLLEAVDKLFTVDKKSGVVSPRLRSATPIPFIRLRWGKLMSYAQGLTDFTFNDFIDCETYLAQYYDGDTFSLYRFIARAYGREWDKVLSEEKIERLAAKIEKNISAVVADAIRLNYEGQKVFLYDRFDKVLQGGSGDESMSADVVFDNYCKLVATLGGGNPAEHEKIKKTFLYDALYALDERMRQIEINTMAHGTAGI
jgi:hypothetical protein